MNAYSPRRKIPQQTFIVFTANCREVAGALCGRYKTFSNWGWPVPVFRCPTRGGAGRSTASLFRAAVDRKPDGIAAHVWVEKCRCIG